MIWKVIVILIVGFIGIFFCHFFILLGFGLGVKFPILWSDYKINFTSFNFLEDTGMLIIMPLSLALSIMYLLCIRRNKILKNPVSLCIKPKAFSQFLHQLHQTLPTAKQLLRCISYVICSTNIRPKYF